MTSLRSERGKNAEAAVQTVMRRRPKVQAGDKGASKIGKSKLQKGWGGQRTGGIIAPWIVEVLTLM